MFGVEYTIFAGLFGSTFVTMATHGTDQDMVQRMLTAPDVRRSRRSLLLSGLADLPIQLVLVSVGLLLLAHYSAHPDPSLPKASNEVFCYYILHQLPVGVRGLLLAGIFATTMGSLSTALNALATSFTRDWYQPYVNPGADERASLRAVRWATVVFAVLMVGVSSGVSYVVIQRAGHPGLSGLRIYPIILGIFGYTYGSLLGVFFAGMLTRTRGNDRGNWVAMVVGFMVVAVLSDLAQRVDPEYSAARRTRCPSGCRLLAFPLEDSLRDGQHVPGGDLFPHPRGAGGGGNGDQGGERLRESWGGVAGQLKKLMKSS